ncbi:hypothetical protein DFA_05936 [Cavenderia fasciculata]|uniref:SET domain-containing protein n=1 Tax=Cavenderia fasciculata TaxID=261658 RepID=F4PJM6_CACFS|nr:uncharacterized protein DFA_05936 [Cavenderia fasciculata]EGG23800.1 hypothetical protein DFA_05936 [Cavenderia fasciculata]|eukprot:XP_004361651.1 hypothetical protein DFA_05936 [Cavenderia fasciculata]
MKLTTLQDREMSKKVDCVITQSEQGKKVYQNISTIKHTPTTVEASQLEPVAVQDLSADTIHTGRVLIVQTVGDAHISSKDHYNSSSSFIQLVISDGDVTKLDNVLVVVVANYRLPGKGPIQKEVALAFPAGVVLAIKEPNVVQNSNFSVVHIANPDDDIEFIEDVNHCHLVDRHADWKESLAARLPKDIEGWRLRGNDFYTQGRYGRALSCYDLGLAGFDKDHSILQLNKLAALLALQRYHECIPLGLILLQKLPQEIKVYARMGKAYYALGLYEQASDSYKKLLKISPKYEEAVLYTKKCKERIEERDNGIYDLKSIRQQAKSTSENPFEQFVDCSEYIGPVDIIQTETMGRGLIVTRDVPLGTLLIVSKGVGVLDQEYKEENMPGLIKQAIKSNPLAKKQLSVLYSGEEDVAKSKNINNNKNPTTTENNVNQTYLDDPLSQIPLDDERIQRIIRYNTYHEYEQPTCGVWPIPSLINHSCLGNVTRFLIGDMMFIHATTNIKANQEIMANYTCRILPSYAARMSWLDEYFGVKICHCQLCQFDQQDTEISRTARDKLDSVYRHKFTQKTLKLVDVPLLENHMRAVKNTYRDKEGRQLALDLFSPLTAIALAYQSVDHHKCLDTYFEILRVTGITVDLSDAENRALTLSQTPIKFTTTCPQKPWYFESIYTFMHLAHYSFIIKKVMQARLFLALYRLASNLFQGWSTQEQNIHKLRTGVDKKLLAFNDTIEFTN